MLTSPRPFFLHSSANSCRVTASVFEPVEMRGGPLNIFDKSIISSSAAGSSLSAGSVGALSTMLFARFSESFPSGSTYLAA